MIRVAALMLAFAACKTPEAPPVPDAGPVICVAGSTRCGDPALKSQPVYRCNEAGTEWEKAAGCMNRCKDGACLAMGDTPY